MRRIPQLALLFVCLLLGLAHAQSTTGTILGTVLDASGAAAAGSKVSVRNLATNATREGTASEEGRFRFGQLPAGSYELTVEKPGFSKYVQRPIRLALNQDAELAVQLQVSTQQEVVTIEADAPIINTTNAEVSTSFDTKRIAELPLSVNRNFVNLALSVPGVSQTSSGQTSFSNTGNTGTDTGTGFSANGMRLRSNNFMIDGQDSNQPSVGGLLQPLNNPDVIAEVRIVTNQFAPEFGRAAGSVLSVITKSGTNQFHGSAFWFNNNDNFNSLSNLDKRAGFRSAPFRNLNQFGGVLGGPVIKNRTFFFGSLQRWTDRRLGSGSTISGAPTEEGRRLLQQLAGTRPQVRALLENLPAGAAGGTGTATINVNGQSALIPLGPISGASSTVYNNWQYGARIDHRFSDKHQAGVRWLEDDGIASGTGQATPVGLTNVNPSRTRSISAFLTSVFGAAVSNELRASFSRSYSETNAQNPAVAERIPSIEVPQLGLTGFNATNTRTAIGLASNLPQFSTLNNYQLANSLSVVKGSHAMKFGIDFRRQEQFAFFFPNIRGRLEYPTLQNLIDDNANVAQIAAPLRGGERIQYYRYYDYFFFLQDEWRVNPNFTLTYGVRYESPGNPFANLAFYNQRIVSAYGGDQRYGFKAPPRDNNNWAPRVGFNWRLPNLGFLTGDRKMVFRGGYARVYDLTFNNIALNVATAFPFVQIVDVPLNAAVGLRSGGFTGLNTVRAGTLPVIANPNQITRTTVSPDFRSPFAEQFSAQIQRELGNNFGLTIGYVGTKGTALFQTVDGNPVVPGTGFGGVPLRRVNNDFGVERLRCNCASSTYHSLQTSVEKRLSQNFAFAAHYTWSSFIDAASEIFNPSNSGEVAIPQDSFNWRADRGRSSYDRPHRFTTNGVFQLPFFREQKGFIGRVLGGWQVNGFLTLQSGAPFSPLNGADPGARVQGISGLVGTSIRPNLNTTIPLRGLDPAQVLRLGGASLFSAVTAQNPIGNVGRNILRADGIGRLDLGVFKNFRVTEGNQLQFRMDMYNATNTRNFGIPEARINSGQNFLNQWALTDGGNRQIQFGLRYSF